VQFDCISVMAIPMHYETDYSRTQIHFLTTSPAWLPCIGKHDPPHDILDLGSGGGQNSIHLRREFRQARIVALDLSFIRCTLCRQSAGVNVVCGNAMELPFASGSFDLVLSTQVIEHVPDDLAFVKEARRILRKGGKMIISSVLRLPHGWYFYRNQGHWVLDPTHVREYRSRDEILALFDSGLSILDVAVDPIRYSPAHFVYRLLIKAGLVENPDPGFFSRTRLSRCLERYGIRIPGYRTITAIMQKV
jgi:2-polyprenyl-3-methyl-5-hydroxy-6-metoxy-1,4-benzoquinol methylase